MRHFPLAFVFALVAAPLSLRAQPVESLSPPAGEDMFTFCELHIPPPGYAYHGVHPVRESAFAKGVQPTATFQVTYSGFSAEAEAAFQAAVDIWSVHLSSSVPIRVDAQFAPLGERVLGSAGASQVHAGGSLPIPDTFYGDALADALLGEDQNPGQPDIRARFSSSFTNWYYGLDGNTPSDQFDFVTVVLHELGHGLGFFGSARVNSPEDQGACDSASGFGCYGLLLDVGGLRRRVPVVYDRFVEDRAGNAILGPAYTNVSQELGNLLQSQDLFFDSPTTFAVYGDSRPPVFAPATWERGSSFSHFDEDVIPTGSANALMTPRVARGESFADPGPLTCALFQDIGWELAPACTTLLNTPTEEQPLASGMALELAGPNPFRDGTALRVRLGAPEALRARLYDALGREAAVLYDGQASGDVMLSVSGDLAPGVYVVRVQSETEMVTERLVRVR